MKENLHQQVRATQFMALYRNLVDPNSKWVALRAFERIIIQYEDNEGIFSHNWGLANNMLNNIVITYLFITTKTRNLLKNVFSGGVSHITYEFRLENLDRYLDVKDPLEPNFGSEEEEEAQYVQSEQADHHQEDE